MGTEKKGFSYNAVKWLNMLGYSSTTLTNPMTEKINLWWNYVNQKASFYWREEVDENGNKNKIKVRSLSPADLVCQDMSELLYNEKASISVNSEDDTAKEWLDRWLKETGWHDKAPMAIQRMCSTGTAAWALHIKGASVIGRSDTLKVIPMRYDARAIIPLVWDNERCTDCAFVSPTYVNGESCTQIEVHRPDEHGNYQVFCSFYDSKGEPYEPEGHLTALEALDTKQQKPTFQIIKLAIDNPYWEYSPMGVALFHNIIDVLETVDLSFDAIGNEIVLGKKMLSVPESMMKRDANGKPVVPHMSGHQFFLATESSTYDDKSAIYEYNPEIRANDIRLMLSTALQMLGKRVGFGTKAYVLDATGSITTAKQVASDNAEIMRTVRKHEHVIEPAIRELIEAAAGVYRQLSTEDVPDMTGLINVVMGDSIIEDDDSLRDRDRSDVVAGLLEPWVYLVRWQGYSEEKAKEVTNSGLDIPLEV